LAQPIGCFEFAKYIYENYRMQDYHIPLMPGGTYHIISHAAGNELLFRSEENYRFFLQKYAAYIGPVADTNAYALLPNHFHFLIRIKNQASIQAHFKKKKINNDFATTTAPGFIMQCFSNFLNSYAKSYNKVYRRMGALFIDYLRRVEVKSDGQFGSTVFYIHKNPAHHGYCNDLTDWHWTSYKTFLSQSPTMILRNETLDWFGGVERFIDYHNQPINLKGAAGLE
jgi:putative transposase